MRKLGITFTALCLLSSSTSKLQGTVQVPTSVEDTTQFKADTAVLNSMLYMFIDNQKKLLEKQDSLINQLN